MRVIWAIHDRDPRFEGEMVYHEEKRGVQSLHLLGPSPAPKVGNDHSRNWDIVLNNVSQASLFWIIFNNIGKMLLLLNIKHLYYNSRQPFSADSKCNFKLSTIENNIHQIWNSSRKVLCYQTL